MMLQRLRKSFFYPERKKPAPRTKDTRSGSVIDDTKRQHGITKETVWAGVPGDTQLYAIEGLETKAAPYIPLRACVGSGGQTCFLSITGATSVDRARKAQVVNQVVEGSTYESRMTATESVHTECTVTGPLKQLLGMRLADKGKQKTSAKRKKKAENEEEYDE
ncbi:hypothetical protein G6F70_003818 [Rhizopus microsporus]|nr:hypothetical protein G6F71_009072 [Rhizopus microsporus]KAG1200706.1 hypothetical protein G6F70_003818 [Rhizopus microsporus]KAG1212459.1 hypothetical protein G6F69_003686 [Rhizopus microsporus]KAG1231072.1 hypothetical protein G6F67_006026 [Rhizopus microsporus]KAG1266825.1 hypothetical protein G6F68_002430 [Rhizopus microsporus]